jgi:LacI family transcriptional regulator
MAGGCKAIEQLLLSHQPPTAAFMYNDQMAVGALHALRTHGLRIPGDFAVVGFDGLAVGQFTAPPLTTIDHPRGDLGRLAVETLIGAIEKKSLEARERMLPVKLLVRESCGGKEAPLPQP